MKEFEKSKEINHFGCSEDCPVKFTGNGGRHADSGPGKYEKEGEKWLKMIP